MSQATDFCTLGRDDHLALARQIQALVARLHPAVTVERRQDDRAATPVLFRLTPLNADHQPIASEAITVVGKNISRRGLSFYHERPLLYRRALISLEHPQSGWFAAEIDLNWCRFTKPGWYESGGRLVRSVASAPVESSLRPEIAACVSRATTIGETCC